jgi:hypothetical protein
MKRTAASVAAILAGFAVLAAPSVGAAQDLPGTFDIIKNAIVSQGAVVWEGFVHDSNPPAGQQSNWTYQRRIEISNYVYDLPGCLFSFHYRVVTDGKVSSDIEAGVPLRQAAVIKVASEASLVQMRDAQSGHPTWSSRIQPEIYDVDVIRTDGTENVFSFYDLGTANNVAREFQRAAAMCGVTNIRNY